MRNFKSCLKGILPFFKIAKGKTLLCVCIGLIGVIASLAFVAVSKNLIDIATGANDKPIMPFAIAMIGLMLFQLLCKVSYNYIEGLNVVKTKMKIRKNLYGHVLNSEWNGQETFHSADTLSRLGYDVSLIVDFCCSRMPGIIITLFRLVAASLFLLMMAPKLLWILLALMVVAIICSRLFFFTIRSLNDSIRQKESGIQAHLQETLQNRIVVLTISTAKRMVNRFAFLQKDMLKDVIKRLNCSSSAHIFMSLGFSSGYILAFLWGVFNIRSGAITFGVMTAFLQLVGQVQRPVAGLAKVIPNFLKVITSIERVMDLQEMPVEKSDAPLHIDIAPEIKINNLYFSYPKQQNLIFNNFSACFPAGKLSAIVGETGSGKSTLTRLVLALLRPQSGTIFIDGHYADTNLRCNFMYVPQGNSLFSGTIRENLLMAKADASIDDMTTVLHHAAADFVFDLPDGLDSTCSERGGGLSEGQAQRIAIARGLLHEGNILILDEATSSVDSQTEKLILLNLKSHYHHRKTILFISHREAVVSEADNIVEL